MPEISKSPQSSNSCCSFGKMFVASFLGSLSAIAIITILMFVLGGMLGAVLGQKLGEGMLKNMPSALPTDTQNIDWEEYFKNQGGGTGSESTTTGEEEYVNPFEKL